MPDLGFGLGTWGRRASPMFEVREMRLLCLAVWGILHMGRGCPVWAWRR